MNKSNIKLSVQAGLQKDWGVFNLYDETAYMGIHVEIFTSGKTYVDSEECSIVHAGESGYKEFEGVYPTNGDDWDLTVLGDKLKNLLKPYFLSESANLSTTVPKDEIYSSVASYQDHKNQFEVKFLDTTTETSTQGQYYDYRNNIVDFIDDSGNKHQSIIRSLESLKGNTSDAFLYLGVKIINFSKYYNVYATDNTVQTPILRPLLYDQEDLEKYGLGIDENNKVPYVKYLWKANFYYGGYAARDDDNYIDHKIYGYNSTSGYYDGTSHIFSMDEDFGGTCDMSMFNTNLNSYKTFWSEQKDWWDSIPKGFLVFGMNDESSTDETFNRNDNKDTSQQRQKHQSSYTSIFKLRDNSLSFDYKHINDDVGSTPLLAIAYNGDAAGNLHIFNSWFPVKMNQYSRPTQTISYQNSAEGKYPKCIGLVVASLLANIYVYSENIGEDISYIPDIIYLSDHGTTYTKDVIYIAKIAQNVDPSSLLLFHRYPFGAYVQTVKDRMHKVTGEGYTSSDRNVTLEMKSCIKNIPLQFRLGYIQPNLDAVGIKSGRAKVKYIDGTEQDVTLSSNSKDDLYQVDSSKEVAVANVLGRNFKIRYLKSVEKPSEGNGLKAEFDTSIPEEKNEWIYKTFKLDGSDLGFKTVDHMQSGYSYSIVTDYYDDVALHHLPKREVIAPFAKIF